MKKVVYFIRHGQAQHNEAFEIELLSPEKALEAYATRYFDSRLTVRGMEEARALHDTVKKLAPMPEVFLSSPLSRTLQTAAVATGALEELPLVALEELRERHGRWPCEHRRTVPELQADFPIVDFQSVSQNDELWKDARESGKAASLRAKAFIAHLLRREEKCLAVVSHSGFMDHSVFGGKTPVLRVEGWPHEAFTNCELRAVEITVGDNATAKGAKLLWRRQHVEGKSAEAVSNSMRNMQGLYEILSKPDGITQLAKFQPGMHALSSRAAKL